MHSFPPGCPVCFLRGETQPARLGGANRQREETAHTRSADRRNDHRPGETGGWATHPDNESCAASVPDGFEQPFPSEIYMKEDITCRNIPDSGSVPRLRGSSGTKPQTSSAADIQRDPLWVVFLQHSCFCIASSDASTSTAQAVARPPRRDNGKLPLHAASRHVQTRSACRPARKDGEQNREARLFDIQAVDQGKAGLYSSYQGFNGNLTRARD